MNRHGTTWAATGVRSGPRRGAAGHAGRPGFTIVEATVTIGIIALLAGIVLYSLGAVRRKGDVVDEQAMVTSLHKAVEKFKADYGFLPPLIVDSGPGPAPGNLPGPVSGTAVVAWDARNLADPGTMLNMSTCSVGDVSGRNCYSVRSLPYYLAGALDVTLDGGSGLTFTAPASDGQFTKRGRAFEPLIDLTQKKTRLGATRLYISNPTAVPALQRVDCRIRDRWSDASGIGPLTGDQDAKEIRYYRWLNAYHPQNAGQDAGKVRYWNIPKEIGGSMDPSMPPSKPELRDAEYAIVSAGPDHTFGTADDIMEVGR